MHLIKTSLLMNLINENIKPKRNSCFKKGWRKILALIELRVVLVYENKF